MTKNEAISFMKNNPGVIVKLDWWTMDMGINFDGNKFVSIPGVTIDTKFLLPGVYLLSDYFNDCELGGLFSFDFQKIGA